MLCGVGRVVAAYAVRHSHRGQFGRMPDGCEVFANYLKGYSIRNWLTFEGKLQYLGLYLRWGFLPSKIKRL